MATPALSREVRRRLLGLLGDEPEGDASLLASLREMRTTEHVPACSSALNLLAHLNVPEAQAERLLEDLLRHRAELVAALGRDPGLRVAAVDFLSNVARVLVQPAIVEHSDLERTERSAITDQVTGLFNRRYFMSALELELRRSRRYGAWVSLLMLDLDGFKALNDLHGHPFGDRVLGRVGRLLRRSVREADVACRFGGEEFAVILPATERLGAYTMAERLRRVVGEDFGARPIANQTLVVKLSGGIAVYPSDGKDATTLIARADKALYLAKNMGRDRISLFHAEKRRAVRYPVQRGSRARIQGAGLAEPCDARPIDLSAAGMLLEVEAAVSRTGPVEIDLSAQGPSATPTRHWTMTGQIVRVERAGTDASARVAVEFDAPLSELCLAHHARRAAAQHGLEP